MQQSENPRQISRDKLFGNPRSFSSKGLRAVLNLFFGFTDIFHNSNPDQKINRENHKNADHKH